MEKGIMAQAAAIPAGFKPESALVRSRFAKIAGAIVSIMIVCIALWFLHRELAGLSYKAVVGHIKSIPTLTLLASVVFAACSYLVLTVYDATALRYVEQKVPYGTAALTSFMAFAVGHNVGLAALSGGSIRYRMYSLAGLSSADIARVIIFITTTFALGASGLLGVALLLMPETQTSVLRLPHLLVSLAGGLLLSVPLAYLALPFLRRMPVKFGNWNISVPRRSIAFTQIIISVADLTFAAATLYILLEPSLHIGFLSFLGLYLLAMGAGVISNVPGGIGVFEVVLIFAIPGVEPSVLLGTIIIYRLIYYVLPLILALTLLVGHESREHGHLLRQSAAKAGDWLSTLAPQVIGMMVFLAGVVLLLSGASPAVEARLALISRAIPLPLLELSHLTGSVAGVGLLILARGLFRRLKKAYQAALAALVIGIAISLIKGLDYEEALLLAATAIGLWYARDEFYRSGSIAAQRFTPQWVSAIVIIFCLTFWVGLISYRHVGYSNLLWWQFAFDAEAPRMLRASVISAVTVLGFVIWKVLRTAPKTLAPGVLPDEQAIVRNVLKEARNSSASVALMGDKRLLWSEDQHAFIMYQVSGNSWIALGDPVGPDTHHEELAWAFRELVDRHNGRPVFYEVTNESLDLYVDLGLTLSKIGENARVSLVGFSLHGSRHAEFRQAVNKARKNGAVFEIVPRETVISIMPELRRVSDNWLADKSAAEKGFSLGSFSEEYIGNFDCAVVRVNGAITAFANLWTAPLGGDLSVDLMRYDQQAPKGIMDYLFVELMLWGATNGYQWFNLGMAPLSGLEQRPLAPLWHKTGHLIFTHGENFYNFEGLRNYKNKFGPEWQPRYLACPGGWWNLPRALLDASRLISGGVAGMLGKS